MSVIDLAALPAPTVVEPLDFEAILLALQTDLVTRHPAAADVIGLESEPMNKLLESYAYREVLLRSRINEAAAADMLATARGADLDNLAVWWGVTRRVLVAADPIATPPVIEVLEPDADLRTRTQTALEGFSCAGPRGAYLWHAREASPQVRHVGITTPTGGTVRVVVLSTAGDGTPDDALLDLVTAALNAEDVRPLCDTVQVQPATIVPYAVVATLHLGAGPDPAAVVAAATAATTAYCDACRLVGGRVARSGLDAALHQPGVLWVEVAPADDLVCDATQAPHCTGITIEVAA